jgi:RimJ/RimL family protein N-acetyltransferase
MYYTNFSENDFPFINEILSKTDPKMVWVGSGEPGDCVLSILRKDDGSPAGSFELSHIDFINKTAVFGVVTTEKHLGKAFVRSILNFLNETYQSGIDTIFTKIPVHNAHAIECNEFIGFEKTGETLVLDDITYDIIVMSMHRENFERKWSSWVGEKQSKR